jgi:hypothetical protein
VAFTSYPVAILKPGYCIRAGQILVKFCFFNSILLFLKETDNRTDQERYDAYFSILGSILPLERMLSIQKALGFWCSIRQQKAKTEDI